MIPVCVGLQAPPGILATLRRWFLVLSTQSRKSKGTEISRSVLQRAQKGDPLAFRTIVDHYDARLRALAYRLLEDRDAMDDCMQEAYIKAFRSMDRFSGRAGLGTWLYRITYNCCIDELRRRRDVVPLPVDDQLNTAASRGNPAEEAGDRADLKAALSALPPDQRAAVMLVDAEGWSYKDAAKVLSCPAGTIASRVNRAHATLRSLLEVTA